MALVYTTVKNGKLSNERGASLVGLSRERFEELELENTGRFQMEQLVRSERRRALARLVRPVVWSFVAGGCLGVLIVVIVRYGLL